jgi:hypothetical protein
MVNVKPLNYYGIVLDESGSMYPTRNATINSLKTFQKEQQDSNNPNSPFVIHTFNNDIDLRFNQYLCNDISLMKYKPSGGTALYDAIQIAINHANNVINNMEDKPLTTSIIIITDGHENSSTNCNLEIIKLLFSKYKELGWNFIFLGANQDAVISGDMMGLDGNSCLSFNQTTNAQYSAMRSVSNAINRVNSVRIIDSSANTNCLFTDEERLESMQNN